MRRADAVAVGDRRQAPDRGAEQPPERLGLRLAQLGELGRHVRDRAMVLAYLLTIANNVRGLGDTSRDVPWGRGRARGGGVTVARQRVGERLHPGPQVARLGDHRGVAALGLRDLL